MKNIHVLPTDKPSRLFKDDFGKLIYSINIDQEQNHFSAQHIYITSDEEIKEGNWFLDRLNQLYLVDKDILKIDKEIRDKWYKKIILTTDQDLDGVQAIDDTFLEWFVKNPSCELVEVVLGVIKHIPWDKELESKYDFEKGYPITGYKIIIPKEEQKQHLIDIMRGDEELGLYEEPKQIKCYCGHTTYCDCSPLEESKQETLEKVKDLSYWRANAEEDYMKVPISVLRYITELENRMFSEEEVIAIVEKSRETGLTAEYLLLTEQFKKK